MTKFISNGVLTFYKNIPNIQSVRYDCLGEKVYSAQKIQKIFAVFTSDAVMGNASLVSWKDLSWTGQKVADTDVSLYVKSSSTIYGLDTSVWYGPYLNTTNDISDFKDQYLQFVVVLTNKNLQSVSYPFVQSIKVSYLSSDNSVKFYTKAFDLGFSPKHILLTYNGTVSEDSIVRFAIGGFDSIDPNDYQYIDPNRIVDMSGLSLLSDKLKVMIEMIGDSNTLITIDEFALMFDGDNQLRLNKEFSSSSSESESSFSSSSSSSSSSSG